VLSCRKVLCFLISVRQRRNLLLARSDRPFTRICDSRRTRRQSRASESPVAYESVLLGIVAVASDSSCEAGVRILVAGMAGNLPRRGDRSRWPCALLHLGIPS